MIMMIMMIKCIVTEHKTKQVISLSPHTQHLFFSVLLLSSINILFHFCTLWVCLTVMHARPHTHMHARTHMHTERRIKSQG